MSSADVLPCRYIRMIQRLLFIIMLCLMAGHAPARGETGTASCGAPVCRQERASGNVCGWDSLPDEQKRGLHRSHETWQGMSPEQRSHLRCHLRDYRAMSASRRVSFRGNYERWKTMSDERHLQLREKFHQWQKLSPEQRQRLREKHRRKAIACAPSWGRCTAGCVPWTVNREEK